MPPRRGIGLALSMQCLLLACGKRGAIATSASDAAPADVADASVVAVLDAAPPSADVAATSDSRACAPAVARAPAALVLKLTLAEHGVDGWVDAFEIDRDKRDFRNRLVVRLRAEGRPPQHINFQGLEALPDPTLTFARFGDSERPSIIVHYDDHGATWNRIHDDVIDIRDGRLVRAVATHVRTGKVTEVAVSTLLSGGSNDGSEVHASADCGYELLMVECESWWPEIKERPVHVKSNNVVLFARGGRWYWNEREGMECVPFGSGHSKAAYPFPGRARFPPSNPE